MTLESNLSDPFHNVKGPSIGSETEEGYLDTFFDIFDAHNHPCILVGEWALRWMGARPIPFGVSPSSCVDTPLSYLCDLADRLSCAFRSI
jgi:hypothetical protein